MGIPPAGADRPVVTSRVLFGALLKVGTDAVTMGVGTVAGAARAAGDMAARAVGSTPLRHPIYQLNDRWDDDRRILLSRLDRSLAAVVEVVLDRFDLTDLVIQRVDVNAIIEQGVDMDAVIGRADIVGLARDVVQKLDLPEIIRDSSGTMATETVESLRVRGMEADRSLSRVVDRVLRRTNARDVQTVGLERSPPQRSS
jgi:hypothetical protein